MSICHLPTVTGTGLPAGTIPAAVEGSVTTGPVYLLGGGSPSASTLSAARIYSTEYTPPRFLPIEPGTSITGNWGPSAWTTDTSYGLGVCEHQLVGDFVLNFKMNSDERVETQFFYYPGIGLMDWANISPGYGPLGSTATSTNIMRYIYQALNDNVTGTIDYDLTMWSNFADTSVNTTTNIVGGSASDIFTIRRVSGVITYERNSTPFYTSGAGITQDLAIVLGGKCGTYYDMDLTYTNARHVMKIGNGSTTGAWDPNFYSVYWPTMDLEWSVTIAGVAAVINTDGYTPPALGEVTVLPYSGTLWFNAGDAGKTVTASWKFMKGLNLV